jgi:hypothetical protein
VHVERMIGSVSTAFGPLVEPRVPTLGAVAHALLPIPNDPGVLGARFATQWFEILPNVTSTNALDCTIAASLPQLGMANVLARTTGSGPIPPSGIVDAGAAHVLRFEFE